MRAYSMMRVKKSSVAIRPARQATIAVKRRLTRTMMWPTLTTFSGPSSTCSSALRSKVGPKLWSCTNRLTHLWYSFSLFHSCSLVPFSSLIWHLQSSIARIQRHRRASNPKKSNYGRSRSKFAQYTKKRTIQIRKSRTMGAIRLF